MPKTEPENNIRIRLERLKIWLEVLELVSPDSPTLKEGRAFVAIVEEFVS